MILILSHRRIQPVENKVVSIVALGEGWHNYHHVFPWDYKAAELGNYSTNLTTFWLDLFAKIGWAYDMKEPSKDLVRRVIHKYGKFRRKIIYSKMLHLNPFSWAYWAWGANPKRNGNRVHTRYF